MTRVHARLTWYLVAIMAGLTIVGYALTGLSIDPFSNPALLAFLGALLALSWFYRTVRPDPRLHTATEAATQILLILILGILLSYAAIATAFPYRDAELYWLDQALGLDRRAYLDFVNSRPWLAQASAIAYLSLLPQVALVPLALFAGGQVQRLHALMLAFGIALLITIAISVFTPALAAFVYLDLTPSVYANIHSTVYTHVPTLEALRSGALQSIRLDNLEGLLTFPSFHTAGGLLFAWALWAVPYVRWVGLAVNSALIAATPVNGAHYFVDLAGGAAVALVGVLVSGWLCRRAERPRIAAEVAPARS